MKTIADFKRKMQPGSKWETIHQFNKQPFRNLGIRECTIAQSNSFALATPKEGKIVDSWCDWPKKAEASFIDENTIKINFGYNTFYKFIQ